MRMMLRSRIPMLRKFNTEKLTIITTMKNKKEKYDLMEERTLHNRSKKRQWSERNSMAQQRLELKRSERSSIVKYRREMTRVVKILEQTRSQMKN
ncbi:unnamed protein product [Parnassius apollo]|uniref:(apollo) hypothetical protein n=1 Tax=Parnassius apollo TaxID=110799 RepID=A0A8S3XIJ0_PARAO|nr:unnamed protein product [Parnassius apollo]